MKAMHASIAHKNKGIEKMNKIAFYEGYMEKEAGLWMKPVAELLKELTTASRGDPALAKQIQMLTADFSSRTPGASVAEEHLRDFYPDLHKLVSGGAPAPKAAPGPGTVSRAVSWLRGKMMPRGRIEIPTSSGTYTGTTPAVQLSSGGAAAAEPEAGKAVKAAKGKAKAEKEVPYDVWEAIRKNPGLLAGAGAVGAGGGALGAAMLNKESNEEQIDKAAFELMAGTQELLEKMAMDPKTVKLMMGNMKRAIPRLSMGQVRKYGINNLMGNIDYLKTRGLGPEQIAHAQALMKEHAGKDMAIGGFLKNNDLISKLLASIPDEAGRINAQNIIERIRTAPAKASALDELLEGAKSAGAPIPEKQQAVDMILEGMKGAPPEAMDQLGALFPSLTKAAPKEGAGKGGGRGGGSMWTNPWAIGGMAAGGTGALGLGGLGAYKMMSGGQKKAASETTLVELIKHAGTGGRLPRYMKMPN